MCLCVLQTQRLELCDQTTSEFNDLMNCIFFPNPCDLCLICIQYTHPLSLLIATTLSSHTTYCLILFWCWGSWTTSQKFKEQSWTAKQSSCDFVLPFALQGIRSTYPRLWVTAECLFWKWPYSITCLCTCMEKAMCSVPLLVVKICRCFAFILSREWSGVEWRCFSVREEWRCIVHAFPVSTRAKTNHV